MAKNIYCGKSYLLFEIFASWLEKDGIASDHIIKVDLEDYKNREMRNPDNLYAFVESRITDDSMYYLLLDEVQMLDHFEDVLNGFLRMRNMDVYVTGSNPLSTQDDIAAADYAVANLEVPLGGRPYSGYPMFSAPDEFARQLGASGFDLLLTANNHCLDRGSKGLKRTVRVLEDMKMSCIGTYASREQRDSVVPFIADVKGVGVAFLNYTYGTNGIPVRDGAVVDMIDRDAMRRDIEKARSEGAKVVCVCLLCRQLFFADFLPAPLIFKLVPVICLATALLYGCFFNYMLGLTKSSAVTGYLAGRIIRIILFVVLFLIYAFSTKEQLYGFAVELMLAFLAYNLFDTVYFVRFEDKSSK